MIAVAGLKAGLPESNVPDSAALLLQRIQMYCFGIVQSIYPRLIFHLGHGLR